ncbi:MAG: hypothetical protein EBU01_03740 [Crocinitomicaceae bacterium]|nr:hypothetical protein [Crocinitomicaceae bacterium]
MIRLFLGNRVGALLLLPLVIAVYYLLNFHTGYYSQSAYVNLGLWDVVPVPSDVFKILSAILILINAISLNVVFNVNEFLEKNAYIISLLYVVTMSFYHSFYSLDGSLIAHTMIILMLYQFFKLKQNVDGRNEVFNGSFFAGLAATLYPPLLLSWIFILIMILIIRPFIFREILISLFSFLTPIAFALTFMWFRQTDVNFKILADKTNFQLQTDFIISIVVFGILLFLSTLTLLPRLQKSSIRLKKQIQIIWILIVLSIIFGVSDFIFFKQIERFSLLMIPLSIILSYSFYHKNYGLVATIIFYLTMLYSVLKFFIFSPL